MEEIISIALCVKKEDIKKIYYNNTSISIYFVALRLNSTTNSTVG